MRLEVKDVSCGYSKDQPIQRFINFAVESGEVCCVLGPNGCGKTTLFKTLLGLLPPLAGSITIDGEDITKWSPKKLATVVAYASQSHVPPFPYRVRDVVLLGRVNALGASQPTEKDFLIVDEALQDMGVYDLRDVPYTDISGGQLQLVMIARALAQKPQVLVLDEPTAALDYGNAIRVIAKVRWLATQGYAVIMTTHSPDHAFMCRSNVVLLQSGKPMVFGPASQIVTEKNMRTAYGLDVHVVEFVNSKNEVMRMCAPEFDEIADSLLKADSEAAEGVAEGAATVETPADGSAAAGGDSAQPAPRSGEAPAQSTRVGDGVSASQSAASAQPFPASSPREEKPAPAFDQKRFSDAMRAALQSNRRG